MALEARDIAMKTAVVLEQHVKNCDRRGDERAERDKERDAGFREFLRQQTTTNELIHSRISNVRDDIRMLVYSIGAFIIITLLGIIAWFIVRSLPWFSA